MNSPDVTTEKLIIESPTVTDKLLLWVSRTFDLYQRVVLRSRSADANKKEFRE